MVMQYYYLWELHSPGGLLDMSHNNNRTYNSSADMGNFIFGANLAAMGYSETEISSFSAAAQPITDAYSSGDWSFSTFTQSLQNYLTNTGDNSGDSNMGIRGAKYYNEVVATQNSSNSSVEYSCIDEETASSQPAVSGAAGYSGNAWNDMFYISPGTTVNGGSGSNGSGYSYTLYCFVQKGYPTYCWLEAN